MGILYHGRKRSGNRSPSWGPLQRVFAFWKLWYNNRKAGVERRSAGGSPPPAQMRMERLLADASAAFERMIGRLARPEVLDNPRLYALRQ